MGHIPRLYLGGVDDSGPCSYLQNNCIEIRCFKFVKNVAEFFFLALDAEFIASFRGRPVQPTKGCKPNGPKLLLGRWLYNLGVSFSP